MLARCSGEFMYAENSWSADDDDASPTFSPYVVQFGLPWLSSCGPRFGLCDSARTAARCSVQLPATVEVPPVTARVCSPCCARAWLIRVISLDAYADGLLSARAVGASAAARPSSAATSTIAAERDVRMSNSGGLG